MKARRTMIKRKRKWRRAPRQVLRCELKDDKASFKTKLLENLRKLLQSIANTFRLMAKGLSYDLIKALQTRHHFELKLLREEERP